MRRLIIRLSLLFLVSCAAAPGNQHALPVWTRFQRGLPTHATVLTLAIDPQNQQRIFAGTYDPTGAYVSTDRAQTWRAFNAGLERAPVLTLRFVGDTLLAGTSAGLYRLRQERWERVDAIPAAAVYAITLDATDTILVGTDERGIFSSKNEGETWTLIGGLDDEIILSIAALDSQTLIAGTSGHGAFITRDGGKSWRALKQFDGEYVSLIAINPRAAHNLYLRTRHALYLSRDDGSTWQVLRGGIETEIVHALLFDSYSHRIYAATGGRGVFVSEDGTTWQEKNNGLPQGVATLALAQIDAQTLIAGTQNGIYLSRDAGQSWQATNEGIGAPQIHALALNPQTGALFVASEDGLYGANADGQFERIGNETMRVPMLSVAIAPNNSQMMYAGAYRRGIFKSRDGGTSWDMVGDIFRGRLSPTGLVIDPQNNQNIFARVLFERIYKSDDAGESWHAVWTGMPDDAEVETMSIAPSDPNRMFAGTNDGLFYSTDGGESWTRRGLTARTVFSIWIDLHDASKLLAGTTDGAYRSDDAGVNWEPIGLESISVTSLIRNGDGDFFAGTKYNGIWISRDNGKSWEQLGSGLDDTSVIALVADDIHRFIYAATPRGLFIFQQ